MEHDADGVRSRPTDWHMLFDANYIESEESGVPFLTAARSLADDATTIVEVGCGRGAMAELGVEGAPPQDLRAAGRTVIGIDIDDVGDQNPMIDEFRMIGPAGAWPLDDRSRRPRRQRLDRSSTWPTRPRSSPN